MAHRLSSCHLRGSGVYGTCWRVVHFSLALVVSLKQLKTFSILQLIRQPTTELIPPTRHVYPIYLPGFPDVF